MNSVQMLGTTWRASLGPIVFSSVVLLGLALLMLTHPDARASSHFGGNRNNQLPDVTYAPVQPVRDQPTVFHTAFHNLGGLLKSIKDSIGGIYDSPPDTFTEFGPDDIYVITLDTPIGRQRLNGTAERLARAGIVNFTTLHGINGNAHPGDPERARLLSLMDGPQPLLSNSSCCCWNGVRLSDIQADGSKNTIMSSAEGACFTSHLRAWRRLADSGKEWILVFEDDAAFTASWPIGWPVRLPKFPPEAEMVMFNTDIWSSFVPQNPSAYSKAPLRYTDTKLPRVGFEGYAISRRAVLTLLKDPDLCVVPLQHPLDWLVLQYGLPPSYRSHAFTYSMPWLHATRLKIYRSLPVAVYTTDPSRNTSEIGKYAPESGHRRTCDWNISVDM